MPSDSLLERLKAWRGEPDEWPKLYTGAPGVVTGFVNPLAADALVAAWVAAGHVIEGNADTGDEDALEAIRALERLLEGE